MESSTASVAKKQKAFVFGDYIHKSSLPAELKAALLQGCVQKVEISTAKQSWRVYYQLGQLVTKLWLDQLAKEICNEIAQLQTLEIIPVYRESEGDCQAIVDGYWPEIVYTVKKLSPIAGNWLEATTRSWEDDTLFLAVGNNIGEAFLRGKGWLQEISKVIEQELGFKVKVETQVNSESRPEATWLAEQHQAETEALLEARTQVTGKAGNDTKPKVAIPADGVLLGKLIKGEPVLLRELIDEEKSVIAQGRIVNIDIRELNTGRKLITFDITDFSDSLSIKYFEDEKKARLSEESLLKKGLWIKVKGPVKYDRYTQELTMNVYDINLAEYTGRVDRAEQKRVELHIHTKMSAMDGVSSAEDLVSRAAKWGHPAVAITDHGVVQGFPEAAEAGRKLGIKVIFGVEGYLLDDGNPIVIGAPDQPLSAVEYVVFDLETTGLSSVNHEIIEVGAVKLIKGEISERFSSFVKPLRPIPSEIVELTGITQNMVQDAPPIEEVLRKFLDFIGDKVLVAHNAAFDTGFLRTKLTQHLQLNLENTTLDTLGLARGLMPHLKNHRLKTLVQELGVSLNNHHRAVDDAEATTKIFFKLLDLLQEHKIDTLLAINQLVKNINLAQLRPFHIIILVKNYVGLRNLYKLITKAHLEYFNRTPRIPKSELIKHREGLIIGSACEAGQLIRAYLDGAGAEKLLEIAKFYDYLEIQPLANNQFMVKNGQVADWNGLRKINLKVVEIGDELKIPVAATGDVHFLEPHDEIYRRVLMAGKGFEDADDQAPLYFRTTDEMLEEFSYLGADRAREVVITNPRAIAEMVEEIKPIPDDLFTPVLEGSEEQIINMTYETARRLYGKELPEIVQKHIDKELNSIITNKFAVLYLIAQKLVKKSNDDGYLVGSRGSVGSSFVATMTGITEVNPLPPHYLCPNCQHSEFITDGTFGSGADMPDKDCPQCSTKYKKDGHDIPFEVFLGFEGDKVPDIDLNFSGDYQPKAHKYTEELFGSGNVFRAGTTGTIAEKTAFGFVKKYFDERKLVKRNAELGRIVAGCTGVKRTTGQHPGGVMVIPNYCDVHDFTPLQHPADDKKSGIITTHFDYHSISSRLVKLDILGHDDPTVIRMLEDLTGIDAKTIPLDEPQVLQLFSNTQSLGVTPEQIRSTMGTYGIPEFGTKFVRQMLEDTKPKTFSECVRISGFSHGTDVWLNNAQDLIRNGTCRLSEAISTRDDIMIFLIFKGLKEKQAFKIMEGVRKGKGVKPEDEEAMRSNQVPEWYIESCKKIKYMFPKAHAVAYVMMAFRIAYFKVYYPEPFYATYFTVRADEFDAELIVQGPEVIIQHIEEIEAKGNAASTKEKNLLTILEVALEMYMRGITMARVSLEKSHHSKFLITEEGVLPPFAALQGVGETAAKNISQAREDTYFESVEDLRARARLSKTVCETLEKHGCLKGLASTTQMELF
ncbi:MAG: PolC-type DNA polymerase III [Carboxydocellales bacterium]